MASSAAPQLRITAETAEVFGALAAKLKKARLRVGQ
jgi:hypothetical protein